MTAKYTVVQYVPNPTAEERMNIGLIVWDEKRVYSHFVPDWSRARSFGGENISFLKDFAGKVSKLTSKARHDYGEFNPSHIQKLIDTWTYSIQLTQPRGSLRDARGLLRDLSKTFLNPTKPVPGSTVRGRVVAVRNAYKYVVDAVKDRIPKRARSYVKKHGPILGHYSPHAFDVVLANGNPVAGVNALSFEIDPKRLEIEINSTAWMIDDVRLRDKEIPLAVYALPPKREDLPLFHRALKTFSGLNASVISNDAEMVKWAEIRVDQMIAQLRH